MARLNLAAEVHRARVIAGRRRTFYFLSVVILVLVVGAWGLVYFLTKGVEEDIRAVEGEIAGLEAKLQSRRDDVRGIMLFLQRLTLLKERLDAHRGWSKVLAELERLVTPSATLHRLGGTAGAGSITIEAVVPTLEAAADLIASLQRAPETNETPFAAVEVDNMKVRGGAAAEGAAPGYLVSMRLTADAGPAGIFSLSPGVQ